MSMPLYDVQALKDFIGIGTHIPTQSEVDKISREGFQTDPVSRKAAKVSVPNQIYIAATKAQVDALYESNLQSASLFFWNDGEQGVTPKDKSIGAVSFDLILDEDHALSAAVCSHPVQYGDPITDHIQPQLPSGRVSVLVSNFSLKDAPGALRQGGSPVRQEWSPYRNRAAEAYGVFLQIFEKRQVCTMVTVLRVYRDVALTNVSAPKTNATGDALIFDVSFQQIRTAQLKTIELSGVAKVNDMNDDNNRQAAPKVSTGVATPSKITIDIYEEKVQ